MGGVSGFLAVAGGAFAAHALKERLSVEQLNWFEVGARYQMYHALALVLIGALAGMGRGGRLLCVAGIAFVAGTVLFSGSLYALALTNVRALGMVTPFGGVAFLVGWASVALVGLRRPAQTP